MKVSIPTTLGPHVYTRELVQKWEKEGTVEVSTEDCLVEISVSGVELDLAGAVLDGQSFSGVGIYVHDCERVAIRNGIIKGFYYGVRAENVQQLTVESCVVSDNHNPREAGWLNDTEQPVYDGFGGGIYLREVSNSLVRGNLLNNNFNGIDLVSSDSNVILRNSASYSGNIGIHLLQSSYNVVVGNDADHCIRYTDHFWCDTADSAGILLEEYSLHNVIVGNRMRYSGDGFFIRANNRHGSNYNYVARNDSSFSPNNAFEAGFSEYNVFEDNVADHSNYGFWLGHSRHTTVRRNKIRSNRFDGISVQNGGRNIIEQNVIDGNRSGVRLDRVPSTAEGGFSAGHVVSGNEIRNSRECGVRRETIQ